MAKKPDHLIQQVFSPEMNDREYLRSLGEIKRFAELWTMAPGFAADFLQDPAAALKGRRINVDPAVLRAVTLREAAAAAASLPEEEQTAAYRRYRAFYREKFAYRTRLMRELCVPAQPEMKAWRARQVNRAWFELGAKNAALIHTPLVFELADGCSVGCPFCGVAAGKLRRLFRYTAENARLWRDVLQYSKELLGAAAGTGTCYYASEPFDNPDYERFSDTFYRVFGVAPQLTTALAARDCARAKAFLQTTLAQERRVHRFSVLSLADLEEIFRCFSPEELVYVELLPQFSAAPSCMFANAGRARSYGEPDKVDRRRQSATISCISGFVVNMARKNIRLITPCAADDARPTGETIIARADFSDAEDYRAALRQMILRYMKKSLPKDLPLVKRPFISLAAAEDGVAAGGPCQFTLRFKQTADIAAAAYQAAARLLQEGAPTAYACAQAAYRREGVPPEQTFFILERFFAAGIFQEPYEAAPVSPAAAAKGGEDEPPALL